ncbi:uncharacterized protein ACA1_386940 [Acanthamoeba castellanii str. Neff]|uniref:Uncharacterized protein n=1 Tax=Acanthamoeba castellanii (strain ATCC 30010 / Neff) TaxID=1257118 RepID=L8H9J0_ACACF|nr:uncharacterized protein ACA1_386940 [Acanthamoeba castellanii str. Neff]ELR21855.1 hypothetical protein ACA1_386940 [Acanthamoeba castellanii str. Neff]
MGVLTMERLLVQELPPSQCILKDGMPEYCIINSNHHIQTAQQLFPGKSFKWCCDIVNNKVSEDDIHILTWGWNHMHDKAAVHKDEWEDFFQYCDTLCTNKFWTTT